jgi:5-methylcytosine-specific restriction endonuclease McrA
MRKSLGKTLRLRLDAKGYRELHRQVLERDGWRCQICGSMQNLQAHHLKFRSQSGGDVEQNLITLCTECHAAVHSKR